jgi:hypothetical protein
MSMTASEGKGLGMHVMVNRILVPVVEAVVGNEGLSIHSSV